MAGRRPNILVLWGDDIGWYNIGHNNRGAMVALRVGDWKVVFAEQRAKTMQL